MKSLAIYSSQTGFTKKYAEKIAKDSNGQVLSIKEVKGKDEAFFDSFDVVVYGGWIMGGGVNGSGWFLNKAKNWTNKKLVIFGCGATPVGAKEVEDMLGTMVPAELKDSIKAFYCPGGLNYDKMGLLSKILMKALVASLRKKKDQTDDDKNKIEIMSRSYDISDMSYVKDIVEYIVG